MRTSDIVNRLAIKLPTFVDDFTTNHDVLSITRFGTTVTVITFDDHNLSVGSAVNIVGARTPITITTIIRVGTMATLTTDADHDVTETIGFENVEIEGATESEFNGTFNILSVINRRNIIFQVEDSGPSSATGSPLLVNGENIFNTYNGLQEVTAVPTTTTFEYEVENGTLFTPASGVISAKERPRISAGVSYDRIMPAYTAQPDSNLWIFVVMDDALAQKNRQITVDSLDNLQRTHYFNQRITQGLSLYLFIPSTTEIVARKARDKAEELFLPICRSILLLKFDSLLSEKFVNPLQFNGHGFHEYNSSVYVHRYTFEQTIQMAVEDTVGADDDVAFRDICLTTGLDVGTETFDTDIDLDDEPL